MAIQLLPSCLSPLQQAPKDKVKTLLPETKQNCGMYSVLKIAGDTPGDAGERGGARGSAGSWWRHKVYLTKKTPGDQPRSTTTSPQ